MTNDRDHSVLVFTETPAGTFTQTGHAGPPGHGSGPDRRAAERPADGGPPRHPRARGRRPRGPGRRDGGADHPRRACRPISSSRARAPSCPPSPCPIWTRRRRRRQRRAGRGSVELPGGGAERSRQPGHRLLGRRHERHATGGGGHRIGHGRCWRTRRRCRCSSASTWSPGDRPATRTRRPSSPWRRRRRSSTSWTTSGRPFGPSTSPPARPSGCCRRSPSRAPACPASPGVDLSPLENGEWFYSSVEFFNGTATNPNRTTCNTCHPHTFASGLKHPNTATGRHAQSMFDVGNTGPWLWKGNAPDLMVKTAGPVHQARNGRGSPQPGDRAARVRLPDERHEGAR